MASVSIDPEKLAAVNKYSNQLPRRVQREYAFGYIRFLKNGAEGLEPGGGKLSRKSAQAIKEKIDGFGLWE